jgi:hypothetical protein
MEVAKATSCNAFVGTFTAALSKITCALILVRKGYIAPYYISLQGCLGHIQKWDLFWLLGETGCYNETYESSVLVNQTKGRERHFEDILRVEDRRRLRRWSLTMSIWD